MGTITLQNFRVGGTVRARVRLKDGGVYVDWGTLTEIKAWLYSVDQKSMSGRFDVTVDPQDGTRLLCVYSAQKPQYLGVNKIIVQAKYDEQAKAYDKPLLNFVRWTADQAGEQITMEDPEVDVEIVAEDISSSILDEATAAALAAADRAEAAAEEAEHMVEIHRGPAGKSPYKGENGNWFEWDEEAGQYVDTGVRAKGETGDTPDISIGTVTTVDPGQPAGATMGGTPEAPVLNLSIPKGAVGATPNFTIGTVATGEPGTPVVVTITGTAEAPVLNITIPQGAQGNSGYQGAAGELQVVNNLTDGGATAALSAEMGKELDGKVSQLQQEVTDLTTVKSAKNLLVLTGRRDATPTGAWPITKHDISDGVWYRGYSYSGYYYTSEANKPQVSSVNNNSITFTQPTAMYGMGFLIAVSPSTTYTLSVGSNTGSYARRIVEIASDGTAIKNYNISNPGTFTTSDTAAYIIICFYSTTANSTITLNNIQLERGDSATAYEPAMVPIATVLQNKQDVLTFDDTPTEGSSNPVKSGGVYSAISSFRSEVDAVAVDVATNESNISKLQALASSGITKSKMLEHLCNPFVKTTIHLFGDSITQGMGSSDYSETGDPVPNQSTRRNVGKKAYAALFESQVKALFNKDIWVDIGTSEEITKDPFGSYTIDGSFWFYNNHANKDYVVFTFTGNHFSVKNYNGIYGGIYDIKVDGVTVKTVDTHASSGTFVQTDITDLSEGEHEVKFVGTGQTQGPAASNFLYFAGVLLPKEVEVINDGVGGFQSRAVNNVVLQNSTNDDNFIIWMAGTNDRPFGYWETQNSVLGLEHWVKANRTNAELIVMSANPCGVAEWENPVYVCHMDDINDAICRTARYTNLCFISHYKYLTKLCREQGSPVSLITTDGVHPNDFGHMLIYQNMCKELNISADSNF